MSTRIFERRTLTALTAGTLALAMATACGSASQEPEPSDEADEIGAALEVENGGLTTEDEMPMFAEAETFEAAGLPEPETPIADEVETAEPVKGMLQKPEVVKVEAAVLWGQIPADPSNKKPYNWSGQIKVNRGALIVRKTIRFEDATDKLLPRTDPQSVEFTSVTLPANDGLRLTILDPTPESPEPLTVTYSQPGAGAVFSTHIKEMLNGPVSLEVDPAGNRIVAVAMAKPLDLCQHGFLGGKWHRVKEGRGKLLGGVVNELGDPMGHMKGIYGKRKNGEQVFFGKYIDGEGHFRGIFAGHYGEGRFEGKWLHAAGEVGNLGGAYWETIPGKETGGLYVGRWAETSCNVPTGPGGPGVPPTAPSP